MALKLVSDTIPLFNIHSFKGFLNWNHIDEMVSNHLSRCNFVNSQQFKDVHTNITKNHSQAHCTE